MLLLAEVLAAAAEPEAEDEPPAAAELAPVEAGADDEAGAEVVLGAVELLLAAPVAAGLEAVEQATAVGRSVTPKPLQSCGMEMGC